MNLQKSTRLMGFNIPNVLMIGIVVIIGFALWKMSSMFQPIIDKIRAMLGMAPNEDANDNAKELEKKLSKDPAVKSQATTGNMAKADNLFSAMDGFGYDIEGIYRIFNTITGPSQMKAIFLAYGTRTISKGGIIFSFTGNLSQTLKNRLWTYQLNKQINPPSVGTINKKLDWI